MLNYAQIQGFLAVAESGSFERAAKQLNLTQSAISQRVKSLEDSLGQLLIIRSQPLGLTSAGERLLAYSRQQQLLEEELLKDIGEKTSGPFNTLTIALNGDSLATWFLDALKPLMEQQTLLLDLRVCDQDQTQQYLRKGEVVACIGSQGEAIQGCRSRPLGTMTYKAVASRSFTQKHFKTGVVRHSLIQAPAVDFNQEDGLQKQFLAQAFSINSGEYPRHRVPQVETYLSFILRGYGWGMVPTQQADPLLKSGELISLFPEKTVNVPLFWHRLDIHSSTLQYLEGHLLSYCHQHLT